MEDKLAEVVTQVNHDLASDMLLKLHQLQGKMEDEIRELKASGKVQQKKQTEEIIEIKQMVSEEKMMKDMSNDGEDDSNFQEWLSNQMMIKVHESVTDSTSLEADWKLMAQI